MKKWIVLFVLILASPFANGADANDLGVAVVTKKCGDAEMSLRCPSIGHGKANCLHPSLRLKTGDGHSTLMPSPKGMEKYSPVGLACAASSTSHANYFVVEYGELPQGCEFCEWHHLYDIGGKLLTSSDPPLLPNPDGPPAQNMAPNNGDFDKLSRNLILEKFEEKYLQCDGETSDRKGNPICIKEK